MKARVARAVVSMLKLLPERARATILRHAPRPAIRLLAPWAHELAPDAAVRVLGGPLAGAEWIASSSIPTATYGTFAGEVQDRFVELVRPGMTVYDIGAHVGFFTLLGARLVGASGAVVAFEPYEPAVRQLRRHAELNRCDNVRIVEAAVGAQDGEVAFAAGAHSSTGRVHRDGTTTVALLSLDSAVAEGLPAPDLVKIDIEGAEADALEGATNVLRAHAPIVVLATHGQAVHGRSIALLEAQGYRITVDHASQATGDAFRAQILALPPD